MSQLIVPASVPVTRRSFLSTSTKVAGTAAALSALPVERFVHGASPGDTIKVALIGMGGRGSGAANQALSTGESVKLVAVADVHKDRMDGSLAQLAKAHKDKVQVKDENKFMGFDAYKKAIAQADLVILATPPGFRPMQFEEAVRQGKHVFMEKPVCVDVAGYKKVIAAAQEAKKKNLKVGVGLQRLAPLPGELIDQLLQQFTPAARDFGRQLPVAEARPLEAEVAVERVDQDLEAGLPRLRLSAFRRISRRARELLVAQAVFPQPAEQRDEDAERVVAGIASDMQQQARVQRRHVEVQHVPEDALAEAARVASLERGHLRRHRTRLPRMEIGRAHV